MPLRIDSIRWPEGVEDKVDSKHGLFRDEVEEAFYHRSRRFAKRGDRYVMLSRTGAGKYIFVVFELDLHEAIVVTARAMTATERRRFRRK